MKVISLLIAATFLLTSCTKDHNIHDASGTFEAVETIVSSEANGVIMALDINEGQQLQAGQIIGYIDSTQLYLRKKQLEAQIIAVLSKRPSLPAQLAAIQEQLKHAEREQTRVSNLVKSNAAPQKQLDDANAQLMILKKQIEAQQSTLGITSASLNQEVSPLSIQIEQLNDQLKKCRIVNPVNGTVLSKYTEVKEMTSTGKPIYKIADLTSVILRAYLTGDQLSSVRLNQKVKVLTDAGGGGANNYDGTIEWISDKAEFTPKTIQTKEERANLVYAFKVSVKNDGYLKIGMYGEVKLAGSDPKKN